MTDTVDFTYSIHEGPKLAVNLHYGFFLDLMSSYTLNDIHIMFNEIHLH